MTYFGQLRTIVSAVQKYTVIKHNIHTVFSLQSATSTALPILRSMAFRLGWLPPAYFRRGWLHAYSTTAFASPSRPLLNTPDLSEPQI